MPRYYKDDIISFSEYDVEKRQSVYENIASERKCEADKDRFFLDYVAKEVLDNYDFHELKSIQKFRDMCLTTEGIMVPMGGANFTDKAIDKGFRYSGFRMSDPEKRIIGVFDRFEDALFYSPLLPFFFEERDFCKFANDRYFTSMTFEEIVKRELEAVHEYYVHTDYYTSAQDIAKKGREVYEEVTHDEMLGFLTKPGDGEAIKRSYQEKSYKLLRK